MTRTYTVTVTQEVEHTFKLEADNLEDARLIIESGDWDDSDARIRDQKEIIVPLGVCPLCGGSPHDLRHETDGYWVCSRCSEMLAEHELVEEATPATKRAYLKTNYVNPLGDTQSFNGVTVQLWSSPTNGNVTVQIDSEPGVKVNVELNEGRLFEGDPDDLRPGGQGACQVHPDVHAFNDECVGFHEVTE